MKTISKCVACGSKITSFTQEGNVYTCYCKAGHAWQTIHTPFIMSEDPIKIEAHIPATGERAVPAFKYSPVTPRMPNLTRQQILERCTMLPNGRVSVSLNTDELLGLSGLDPVIYDKVREKWWREMYHIDDPRWDHNDHIAYKKRVQPFKDELEVIRDRMIDKVYQDLCTEFGKDTVDTMARENEKRSLQ